MMNEDWQAFYNTMNAAAYATGRQPMAVDGLKIIFRALSEYTIEEIRKAVSAHLVSDRGNFVPTAADIVRQIRGTSDDRAEIAWREVLEAADRYGYYESVRFPAAAYHYAITKLGGWEEYSDRLMNMSDRQRDFARAEFVRLYALGERLATFGSASGRETVPQYLRGFYERSNAFNGYDSAIPDPVAVGSGHRVSRQALAAKAGRAQARDFAQRNEYAEAMKKLAESIAEKGGAAS